jgi:6-phosphogluconolactonase
MHSDLRLLSRLSRRAFLRSTTSLAALAQLRWVASATAPLKRSTFAYVASEQNAGNEDGSLQVYSLHSKRWAMTQRVSSRAPAYIVLSPDQQTLYVANHVDNYEGQSRGSVEAFQIDPSNGHLRPLSQQALSLSATLPRHMALSPNGRLLAVAADGGAIYNVLPVSADGSLDRPRSIFKEVVGVSAQAHPNRLLFDCMGNYLLSSGFENGRPSAFSLAQNPMSRRMQRRIIEVDDLGACALHPDGTIFYVWHKGENGLSCYPYDSASGKIGEAIQKVSMPMHSDASSPKGLAIHPSGGMLYTAHSRLQAWQIHAQDRLLSPAKHIDFDSTPGNEIITAANGESLFVLDCLRGMIHRIAVDHLTGEPGFVEDVAVIHGARSMVVKTL